MCIVQTKVILLTNTIQSSYVCKYARLCHGERYNAEILSFIYQLIFEQRQPCSILSIYNSLKVRHRWGRFYGTSDHIVLVFRPRIGFYFNYSALRLQTTKTCTTFLWQSPLVLSYSSPSVKFLFLCNSFRFYALMTSQCCVHQEALFQLAALSMAINTQQCAPENKIKSVKSVLRTKLTLEDNEYNTWNCPSFGQNHI